MQRQDGAAHAPLFTILTPTYNRSSTLPRVFASLAAQTCQDFEWLIIDDGSRDGTEQLVQSWHASFPIRYQQQENAGKHVAINHGVAVARGELVCFLDSDNAYVPTALERFAFHWQTIPSDRRHAFTGVSALCQTSAGQLVGTRFPFDPTDSDSLEIRLKYKVTGEKAGFHRLEVLKRFPAPRFPGETALPDSVMWHRIARHYKTRYVNEQLQVYYFTPQSWGANNQWLAVKNPCGQRLAWREFLNNPYPIPFGIRLKAYVKYIRAAFLCGASPATQWREVPSRLNWALALPIGYLFYLRGRAKSR